jgi:multiple sugar transport system permease protein
MTAGTAQATGKPRPAGQRQRARWVDWMPLPALLVIGLVIGYPIVEAVIVSLQHYTLLPPQHTFAGAANYSQLVHDPVFWQSLRNTGVYTGASVLFGMLVGLVLALALDRLQGPWRFVRGLLLTPWAVPVIVVAFLFQFMFTSPGGIVNALLLKWGLIHSAVPWLTSPNWAMTSVVIANVWTQAPFFLLVFTAALASVPNEVIEAARVDRASTWSMITRIKLPYLRGAALVGALLMIIQNFNNFPLIWAMTGGGPAFGTSTLVIYVYQLAFTEYKLGYASAIGVVWLVLLLIIASFFIRVLRSRPT